MCVCVCVCDRFKLFHAELFHTESVRGRDVRIYGYLPPKKVIWYLSVLEHSSGEPERYPKFRPKQEIEVRIVFYPLLSTSINVYTNIIYNSHNVFQSTIYQHLLYTLFIYIIFMAI